jgi:phage portal protein BeeE
MNKRIIELADKAIEDVPNAWMNIPDEFCQKFAELIVRECIEIGDNYQEILRNEPECYNCRKVAYGIVDKIKQRFGVE